MIAPPSRSLSAALLTAIAAFAAASPAQAYAPTPGSTPGHACTASDADTLIDQDGDGVARAWDPDDDGDGLMMWEDPDDDNDGIGDAEDADGCADYDGDGVPDSRDGESKNRNYSAPDSDHDGIGDDLDDFPHDPNRAEDTAKPTIKLTGTRCSKRVCIVRGKVRDDAHGTGPGAGFFSATRILRGRPQQFSGGKWGRWHRKFPPSGNVLRVQHNGGFTLRLRGVRRGTTNHITLRASDKAGNRATVVKNVRVR